MIWVYLLYRSTPGQAVGSTVGLPSDGHGKGQWIPATALSARSGQIRPFPRQACDTMCRYGRTFHS